MVWGLATGLAGVEDEGEGLLRVSKDELGAFCCVLYWLLAVVVVGADEQGLPGLRSFAEAGRKNDLAGFGERRQSETILIEEDIYRFG